MQERALGVVAVLAWMLALVLLLRIMGDPMDGEHYGRQALVQSQIERGMQSGNYWNPGTFNHASPPLMYEIPVFHWAVSLLAAATAADSLLLSRLVNAGCFALAMAAMWWLLRGLKLTRSSALLICTILLMSPLLLHYGSVPISDFIPLALGLLAMAAVVRLDREDVVKGKHSGRMLVFVAAFLAALVKCTALIPAATALLFHAVARRGWKGMLRPESLIFFAGCTAGTGTYVALQRLINQELRTPNDTWEWLIGTLEARCDPQAWARIGVVMERAVIPSPLLYGGAVALVLVALLRRSRVPALFVGWICGGLLYVVAFFPLHVLHSYYQLPLVFPVAACVGLALAELMHLWQGKLAKQLLAGMVLLIAAAVPFELSTLGDLRWRRADDQRRCGAWIADHTGATDFVIYVTESDFDANDLLLYSARREGYHLGVSFLERSAPEAVAAILDSQGMLHGSSPYERVCIFAPRTLADRVQSVLSTFPQLTKVSDPQLGDLYLLTLREP